MRIYTKTGDDGTTGLVGSRRVAKTSALIDAIGAVDELNAAIGVARLDAPDDADLRRLQHWLFDFGADLASESATRIGARHIEILERGIDALWAEAPPLKSFVLPGGSPLAAHLHVARTVCRRAERAVLITHAESPISQELRTFLNRLSDWLFAAARAANARVSVSDVLWEKSGIEPL